GFARVRRTVDLNCCRLDSRHTPPATNDSTENDLLSGQRPAVRTTNLPGRRKTRYQARSCRQPHLRATCEARSRFVRNASPAIAPAAYFSIAVRVVQLRCQ